MCTGLALLYVKRGWLSDTDSIIRIVQYRAVLMLDCLVDSVVPPVVALGSFWCRGYPITDGEWELQA